MLKHAGLILWVAAYLSLSIGCAFFVAIARADVCKDTHYSVSLGSIHSKDSRFTQEWQEFNPGVGVECDSLQFGVYRNSIDQTTMYVGAALPASKYAGIRYGAATGYMLPISPYVAIYMRSGNIELTVLPETQYNPWTLGYSMRF